MATLETQQIDAVIANSRRRMLTLGGAALAGLAFTSVVKAQSTTTTLTDNDYLNFALNLEFLEANFYTLAATGQTIDQVGLTLTGTGTQGIVVTKPGGPKACMVPFTNTLVQNYCTEIAAEERNHVSDLQAVLGTAAVAQPQIDLYNSFNGLAGLLGLGLTSFDPFADDASFLLGSYIFEDVGVTAYTGAAPALTVTANLDAAAGIQAVEAYHAGMIRTTIYALDQSTNNIAGAGLMNAPAGTLSAVATAVSKLRATVDGSNSTGPNNLQGDDIGLGTQMVALNGTSANYVASTIVDATTTGSINAAGSTGTAGSMVFARTAAEVLRIVYASAAGTPGGFFPAGLNGNVK